MDSLVEKHIIIKMVFRKKRRTLRLKRRTFKKRIGKRRRFRKKGKYTNEYHFEKVVSRVPLIMYTNTVSGNGGIGMQVVCNITDVTP